MAASISMDRAAELLAAGIKGEQVAATLGCDPSYISQLLAEPGFKERVSGLRLQRMQANLELDSTYDRMEAAAAKQLERLMPLMMKPMEILKAMQTLNSMKRRSAAEVAPMQQNIRTINIVLPQATLANFQVNSNNEVVQVDDMSLVTMPSRQFKQTVKEYDHERLLQAPGNIQRAALPPVEIKDGSPEHGKYAE